MSIDDDKWEEEETLTLPQKIKNFFSPNNTKKVKKALSPPLIKPVEKKTKRVKKSRHKNKSNAESVDSVSTNVTPELQPMLAQSPTQEQPQTPTQETPIKSEEWEKDKPTPKRFVPNLDKQLPLPMVIKRIMAAIIVISIVTGIIFVVHEPTPVALLLIIGFLLLDYLSITGSNKEEKWND